MTYPKHNGIVWSDLMQTIRDNKPLPADMGFKPPQPLELPAVPAAGPMCRLPELDLDEDPPVPSVARAYGPLPEPAPSRPGWLRRAIERLLG